MPGQKPVREAEASPKVLSSSMEVTPGKEGARTKGAASTGLSASVARLNTKPANSKELKVLKAPVKKSVSTLTKPTTVPSIVKEVAKTVEKKSKEQVKKTSEADKKETKAVTSKKEAMPEKKSRAEGSLEKEPKVLHSKASKSEVEPVVIPKTSTDKKVDYEPDFLKSVLDSPASAPQGPTMRYSDTELQEFRDLIGKKLDAAKKELAYLQGLITRRDEMGGDETDNRYMTMEDGGMSMEREQLSQMASRQITFIDHLEKAIMRIENKTYGICRVTGKLIDKARLRAVPHATLSMEAKLGITK
jgi:RNA polymerase-binding transcription factor DksA